MRINARPFVLGAIAAARHMTAGGRIVAVSSTGTHRVRNRAYAPLVGRAAVPTLTQLGWPAGERAALALLLAGIAGLAAAVGAGDPGWIRAAGLLLAAGALVFAVALARVVHHLVPCPMRTVPAAGRAAGR